jgi:hypothetical protein
MGLRTGSTISAGQAGTNGQDSSEVAAEAEVKVGVVTFYGNDNQTTEVFATCLGDQNKIKRYVDNSMKGHDENVEGRVLTRR